MRACKSDEVINKNVSEFSKNMNGYFRYLLEGKPDNDFFIIDHHGHYCEAWNVRMYKTIKCICWFSYCINITRAFHASNCVSQK